MKRDGIIHEKPLSVLGQAVVQPHGRRLGVEYGAEYARSMGWDVGPKTLEKPADPKPNPGMPRSKKELGDDYMEGHGMAATSVKKPGSRGGSVYRTRSGTLRYKGADGKVVSGQRAADKLNRALYGPSAVKRPRYSRKAIQEAKRTALLNYQMSKGKYKNIGKGNKQMDQGGYTSPSDIKKYQQGKLPRRG